MERKPDFLTPELQAETKVEAEPAPGLGTFELPASPSVAAPEQSPPPVPVRAAAEASAPPTDPLYLQVQKAMSAGLDKHLASLSLESIAALDAGGDVLAAQVRQTIGTPQFHPGKTADRVLEWLMSVPGMGFPYAEQHRKVVADRLVRINEEKSGSSVAM